jgi:hypothetical protein
VHEFGPGADPVSAEPRAAEPERDRLAGLLEWEIEAELHPDFDRPLDLDDRGLQEQRVTYIYFPPGREPERHPKLEGPMPAGWVWWVRGTWWWRLDPARSADGDPYGLEERQAMEVDTEAEAILHARRRVAWALAGAVRP